MIEQIWTVMRLAAGSGTDGRRSLMPGQKGEPPFGAYWWMMAATISLLIEPIWNSVSGRDRHARSGDWRSRSSKRFEIRPVR